MTLNSNAAVQGIQSLYLSPNGADIFFIFGDERVPAHRHILGAMCPHYQTMFYGSLPEGEEVDLSLTDITAATFKEFLKFCYMLEPKLTMDNMKGVMFLAKQSLSDEIFTACEEFMKKSVTADTMFFGYQLALLYDANNLREFCEEEICVNAEQMFRSSSFLTFPHKYLLAILKCDSLACEEIHIFNACVGWARAACRRNGTNPSNADNLRYQLGDAVEQIRFTSMTKEALATCMNRCPGLFSVNELQEIISMVAQKTAYSPKHFNWKPRYFNSKWNKNNEFCEYRSKWFVGGKGECYQAERDEITRFTSNRRALLLGFMCDNDERLTTPIRVVINEFNPSGDVTERYIEPSSAAFTNKYKMSNFESYLAFIELTKPIFIRPKYSYEIHVHFEALNRLNDIKTFRVFSKSVRINHDIVFKFTQKRGIVAGVTVRRFDNRMFIQKIIRNPMILIRPFYLILCAFLYIFSSIMLCLISICSVCLDIPIVVTCLQYILVILFIYMIAHFLF